MGDNNRGREGAVNLKFCERKSHPGKGQEVLVRNCFEGRIIAKTSLKQCISIDTNDSCSMCVTFRLIFNFCVDHLSTDNSSVISCGKLENISSLPSQAYQLWKELTSMQSRLVIQQSVTAQLCFCHQHRNQLWQNKYPGLLP